jgi:hypothetical protein
MSLILFFILVLRLSINLQKICLLVKLEVYLLSGLIDNVLVTLFEKYLQAIFQNFYDW